ncbi:unnamed protein product [Paramecium octaurelia]|uniref:WD domain, G-beta repeat protein n=1 Tax=Paramecium octaurelia TaxID=43137 RepID=A0A8S1WIP0_PAROT|nr:unnamed protein product [Paramecium octaurelia]
MIKYQILENEHQIKCSKNHNQPIQMVLFDEQLSNADRLLCNECMNHFEGNVKIVGFQKVLSTIENDQKRKFESVEIQIMESKQILQVFGTKAQNLKTKILSQFDQLLGIVQQWQNQLDQVLRSTFTYSFFEELDNLIKNKESKFITHDNLIKNNQSFQQKMVSFIDQLMNQQLQNEVQDLKRAFKVIEKQESTKNYFSKEEHNPNIINQIQNFEIKLIDDSMLQPGYCRAISFNNSDQIMISTCNSEIRVFRFENSKIKELCKLEDHSLSVNVLIFSKFSNSFISGSADCSIRCWQQQEQNQWISSKPYIEHSKPIYCIILNQKENLLFSAGNDKIIMIWELSFIKNVLKYKAQLNMHQEEIYGLSLNDSETLLVSCGKDKRIIIWKKEGDDWIFNHIVNQSINEFGQRIKFLRDDLFLWVAANSGVSVFELQNGVFQENKDKEVELCLNVNADCYLFPILCNPNKNLIIIRHKCCIYIIKETLDHKFQIVRTIECLWNKSLGTITNDGQFLVFWDCAKFEKNESSNGRYYIYRLQDN